MHINLSKNFNKVDELFENKEYKGAAALCEKMIEDSPSFLPAYVKLAEIYEALRLYEKAIDVFETALIENDEVIEIYIYYSNLLNKLERFNDAIKLLNSIEDTNYIDIYLNKAMAYEGIKDYKNALRNYDIALHLDEKNHITYINLAAVYLELKQYSKALTLCYKALNINENTPLVYVNLAYAYFGLEDLKEAKKAILKANSLEINITEEYVALIDIMDKCGMSKEADFVIKEALAKLENDNNLLIAMGIRYLNNLDYQAAIKTFESLVLESGGDGRAYNYLAYTYIKLGENYEKAADYLKKSLSFNFQFLEANKNMYRCLLLLLKKGSLDKLNEIFDWWKFEAPLNPFVRHFSNIKDKKYDKKVPLDFIRYNDFDDIYFNDYSKDLEKIIKKYYKNSDKRLNILELGANCGKLCNVLSPFAKNEGYKLVDISKDMLEISKENGEYDFLIEADFSKFLQYNKEDFDLIVAIDSFGYVGYLSKILNQLAQNLSYGGKVIITLEKNLKTSTISYNDVGSFCYNKDYVIQEIMKSSLNILSLEDIDDDSQISSMIIVLTNKLI